MENASKALVMAGGVLIALMVIATLVYAANMWGIFPSASEESEASKQLAKFNMEYESYNKQVLYGTDLVSVLNKAIDYNKALPDAEKATAQINIQVTMKKNVDKKTETYQVCIKGNDVGKPAEKIKTEYVDGLLKAGRTYSIIIPGNDLVTFLENFVNDSGKITIGKKETTQDGRYQTYTVETVENSEFKTRLFRCNATGYSDVTGRINYMEFVETDENEIKNN